MKCFRSENAKQTCFEYFARGNKHKKTTFLMHRKLVSMFVMCRFYLWATTVHRSHHVHDRADYFFAFFTLFSSLSSSIQKQMTWKPILLDHCIQPIDARAALSVCGVRARCSTQFITNHNRWTWSMFTAIPHPSILLLLSHSISLSLSLFLAIYLSQISANFHNIPFYVLVKW